MNLEQLSKAKKKLIKSLMDSKKQRSRHQSFVVEGLKGVKEALEAGFTIDFAVVSEGFSQKQEEFLSDIAPNIPVVKALDKDFNELSDTVTPQGILAVVKVKGYSIDDVTADNSLIVALDRISDPGNLGTILRTSDAAGADAVILGKGCVDVYNPKVVRATMGSIFHIPLIYTEDLVETLNRLKFRGFQVVTTHLEGASLHWDIDYRGPTVIVMGNEDEGVLEEIVELSDVKALIKMPGDAESLNVSVAHGIVIFEAVKQRYRRSLTL